MADVSEPDGPVTLVVRHRVRPGRQAEFEDWLRGVAAAALRGQGHPALHVVRPPDPHGEYLVLLRFDSTDGLEAWERSDERREWLARGETLIGRPLVRQRHTGMEVWFTPPAGRPAPPRYKMAVVTLLTIYPLIMGVQAAFVPLLAGWPVAARTLATAALVVCVMTYLAMPLTTRLFGRWLYGPADR